jgi:hypothetical protein
MPVRRLCWLSVVLLATPLGAQQGGDYDLRWSLLEGGSARASSGNIVADHTLGQPEAGPPMTAGSFSLQGGFWAGVEIHSDSLFANGFEQ